MDKRKLLILAAAAGQNEADNASKDPKGHITSSRGAEIVTVENTVLTCRAVNAVVFTWFRSRDGQIWEELTGTTANHITETYLYQEGVAGEYYYQCLMSSYTTSVLTPVFLITVSHHLPEIEAAAAETEITYPKTITITSEASEYTDAEVWQVSTDAGVTWADISGETNPTISLTYEEGDEGVYLYRVKGTGLGGTGYSNVVTVTVDYAEPDITITADKPSVLLPDDDTPETVVYTAAYSAVLVNTIQWQEFNGTEWQDVEGETGSTYSRTYTYSDDLPAGRHRVRIRANGPGGQRDVEHETDIEYEIPEVIITASQTDLTLPGSVTLTASESHAETRIWQTSVNGGEWTDTGKTGNPILEAFNSNGTYRYRSITTGRGGTVNSNVITITVHIARPDITITADKETAMLTDNDTPVTVVYTATYSAPLVNRLQWQEFDGSGWQDIEGETSKLYVAEYRHSDGRPYGTLSVRAYAEGPGGNIGSEPASVSIDYEQPSATITADKVTAAVGELITFNVTTEAHVTRRLWQVQRSGTWWDIGGAEGTEFKQIYSRRGTYPVRCTVSNNGKPAVSNTITITVQ